MNKLNIFKGNVLTKEEKKYRMEKLKKKINGDNLGIRIDRILIPYLKKINSFSFIMTTGSCWGHNGNNDRKARVSFRSALSEKDTINFLLRPMYNRFKNIIIELILEERLWYCLWLDNNEWKSQFEYFIKLLEAIK